MADLIAERQFLRALVRLVLPPAMGASSITLRMGTASILLLMASMLYLL